MPKPGKNRSILPLVGYYIPSPFAKLDRSYKLGNSKNNNTIVVEKYPLIVSLQTGELLFDTLVRFWRSRVFITQPCAKHQTYSAHKAAVTATTAQG